MKNPDESIAPAEVIDPSKPQAEIEMLPLADVLPSSLNPRTHFDPEKLADLQSSFRAHGFNAAVSHLLVRVHNEQVGKYELICGERRWRAAGAEKIEWVPAVVQGMSDLQVLELQMVENLQRDDLTPIEEAEGYRRLLAQRDGEGKPAHTVKSLAVKLGKTEMHVRDRLSLCRLRGTRAGEELEAGMLTVSHARLLARLPSTELRDELAVRIVKEALSYKSLDSIIKNEVMIELRGAPFDQADAELVPAIVENGERLKGGACGDCPFNTKNIEGENGKMHLCMHPECFREKKVASHAKWQESVRKPGVEALGVEDAERLLDYTGKRLAFNSGYVELKDTPAGHEVKDSAEDVPQWKKLIKGQGVPIVLIKDREGAVHEIVERTLAVAAAEANEYKIFRKKEAAPSAARKSDEQMKAENERYEKEREERGRVEAALRREMLIATFGLKTFGGEFWRLIIDGLWQTLSDTDGLPDLAVALGVPSSGDATDWSEQEAALRKHIASRPPEQLPGVALLMVSVIFYEGSEEMQNWQKAACKLLGIDPKAVAKRVKLELAEEEKRAADAKEIVEGMVWVTKREKVADFEWDGANALTPDVCEVRLPADVRQTVAIFAARGKTGWHAGYKIVNGKHVTLVDVVDGPPNYSTRELAVKSALLNILAHYEAAHIPAAQVRLDAYIEQISMPEAKAQGAGRKAKKAAKI